MIESVEFEFFSDDAAGVIVGVAVGPGVRFVVAVGLGVLGLVLSPIVKV